MLVRDLRRPSMASSKDQSTGKKNIIGCTNQGLIIETIDMIFVWFSVGNHEKKLKSKL